MRFKAGHFRGVVYQPPHQMRRAGGTAAKASADIRQKSMLCVVLAAVRWVGVSRIFSLFNKLKVIHDA